MNKPSNSEKKVWLKRLLFLELTGVVSILLTVAALGLLISLNMLNMQALIIPGLGFLLILTFIILSIRYARRDIHKIHELHNRGFYKIGRLLVYGIGLAMIGYTFFLIITQKDIFSSIGSIIEAELILTLGVLILYYTYTLQYLVQNEHLRHEKANFWDIFWVIIFPVMLVAGSIYMLFSEKAETVMKGKADFEMTPGALIAEFEKNDSLAKQKYSGKSIKFSSRVLEISGDSAILLKLYGNDGNVTVNCGFDKSLRDSVAGIVEGDSVVLQCGCGGFIKPDDEESLLSEKYIEMNRCNLLKLIRREPRIGTDIENPLSDTAGN